MHGRHTHLSIDMRWSQGLFSLGRLLNRRRISSLLLWQCSHTVDRSTPSYWQSQLDDADAEETNSVRSSSVTAAASFGRFCATLAAMLTNSAIADCDIKEDHSCIGCGISTRWAINAIIDVSQVIDRLQSMFQALISSQFSQ